MPHAVAGWAGGIALFVLVWLVGYARFVTRLPAGLDANAEWLDEWRALLTDHGVQHTVPLRVTADMGPMLCRLPRGYELLVPGPLWQELNATERAAILRHELAHLVRRDVWKSLGVRVLALPHWFNAFAWWAVRRFDEAAEWACDRAASGNQATTVYARALVRLGEVAGRHASYSPAVRGRPLASRIRRLLAGRLRKDSSTKKALLLAACTGFALAALVRVELVARETTPQSETAVVDSELLATADDAPLLDSVSANVVEDIQSSDEPAAAVPAIENQEAALVAQPASDTASAGRGEGAREQPAPGPARPLYPEVTAAARAGFEVARQEYDQDRITLDGVCAWSLRWLAAENSSELVVENPADADIPGGPGEPNVRAPE